MGKIFRFRQLRRLAANPWEGTPAVFPAVASVPAEHCSTRRAADEPPMSRSPALPRRCDRPRRTCVIVPVVWLLASVPQWGRAATNRSTRRRTAGGDRPPPPAPRGVRRAVEHAGRASRIAASTERSLHGGLPSWSASFMVRWLHGQRAAPRRGSSVPRGNPGSWARVKKVPATKSRRFFSPKRVRWLSN